MSDLFYRNLKEMLENGNAFLKGKYRGLSIDEAIALMKKENGDD